MKISNAAHAALVTALQTFIGLFAISAIGWLQDVAQWASTSGHTPLPGLSVLGYAAVSAFSAAVIGLGTYVVRALQANAGVGAPPVYETTAVEQP